MDRAGESCDLKTRVIRIRRSMGRAVPEAYLRFGIGVIILSVVLKRTYESCVVECIPI